MSKHYSGHEKHPKVKDGKLEELHEHTLDNNYHLHGMGLHEGGGKSMKHSKKGGMGKKAHPGFQSSSEEDCY